MKGAADHGPSVTWCTVCGAGRRPVALPLGRSLLVGMCPGPWASPVLPRFSSVTGDKMAKKGWSWGFPFPLGL